MKRLEVFEDYFVNIYKKFGICNIRFEREEVNLDGRELHKMIFGSKDFNAEYTCLLHHCQMIYNELKHSFCLCIKKDISNNYYVLIKD